MDKLETTIANLKMVLADIAAKESHLQDSRHQLGTQLSRLPKSAMYNKTSLESTLAMMQDIEERLGQVESSLRHLAVIKQRAQEEVESLELTRIIGQAKAELASLQTEALAPSNEGQRAEIRRLQQLINEASERAARSLAEPHFKSP